MPTLQMDLKALKTKTNTEINEFHRFVISYYATTPIKFFQLIVITFVVSCSQQFRMYFQEPFAMSYFYEWSYTIQVHILPFYLIYIFF